MNWISEILLQNAKGRMLAPRFPIEAFGIADVDRGHRVPTLH
jgi:hypothetical protein